MLKIIHSPNKILTEKAKPVGRFNKKLRKLLKDMQKTLAAQKDPEGVGLAAPQVGVSQSIFIMKPHTTKKLTVCINPKIIKKEGEPIPMKRPKKEQKSKASRSDSKFEGCLSIPKIWGAVLRYPKIYLHFQDATGQEHKKWFSGFEAIIVQHEVDHLEGILFTSRTINQGFSLYEEGDDELKRLEY